MPKGQSPVDNRIIKDSFIPSFSPKIPKLFVAVVLLYEQVPYPATPKGPPAVCHDASQGHNRLTDAENLSCLNLA